CSWPVMIRRISMGRPSCSMAEPWRCGKALFYKGAHVAEFPILLDRIPYRLRSCFKIHVSLSAITECGDDHRHAEPECLNADAAKVHGRPPQSAGAPLGLGEQEVKHLPLRLATICGIVTDGAHRRYALPAWCGEGGV